MQKKVLILGATGFIGRNLAERLAARGDLEVYGSYFRSKPLDHPKLRMVQADLTRREDVERVLAGMDIVFQGAAVTTGSKDVREKPYIHITDNAVMNSLIFRACFELSIPHLIFPSCSVLYQDSQEPQQESDFNPGNEIYPSYFGGAWNKIYFEKMCEFYSRLGRNRFTVLRHSNIYGPWDKYDLDRSHVFGATVTKVMTARQGKIVIWGNGEEGRDLLHICDLVDLIELAMERGGEPFALYNAGSGAAVPINELVRLMVEISGRNLKIEHDLNSQSMQVTIALECSKALQELGWQPKIPLRAGIERTLAWYREHFPCT